MISFVQKLEALHRELGISSLSYQQRGMAYHLEPEILEVGDLDPYGNEMLMIPATAIAWKKMKEGALSDKIYLVLESAFRSIETQASLIREQMSKGESLELALTWIAAPGYSEHHSGRALDIGSKDCFPIPISDEFERTDAFKWLSENAHLYGFSMSYPRDNPYGIIYEPWHWLYTE